MIADITQYDVMRALDNAGLKYQVKGRYIVSQCPKHEERNPSCQIFLDDFFCSCLAGCGRFSITDPFPELLGGTATTTPRRAPIETEREYQQFDLYGDWAAAPLIPREHVFKGIPLETLDDLGWRWDADKDSYFIPYFDPTRTKVPFAQWRHLRGERRFTFLAGARPTLYGKWNIAPGNRLFIVEGASDAAVMQQCMVPWVGLPSASSGTILRNFAKSVQKMGITLVYAGDRDVAGDALKEALNESKVPYRVCQPPEPYKDWGEFYEAEGEEAVIRRCFPILLE